MIEGGRSCTALAQFVTRSLALLVNSQPGVGVSHGAAAHTVRKGMPTPPDLTLIHCW